VEAFASVSREQYLPAGPWTILSEADMGAGPATTRFTADADPARVYHNIAIAIDAGRQLFNGQPGTIGAWVDQLELRPGARVLHVGCGLGYYTAIMAHCAGSSGHVVAVEVDPDLAAGARRNLAAMPWVDVWHGDGSEKFGGTFDAILINVGVTHPLPDWLDALAEGGRLMVPLTVAVAAMGATLGKGLALLVARDGLDAWRARVAGFVAIYSAERIRDAARNDAIGRALAAGPAAWQRVAALRRDPHDPDPSCWLHGADLCVSAAR
jgi:protein-L-isoaspartate(D-aspartate) O-methyltransferase